MKLGEFIKNFSHNNIIRLHHKRKRGHQCVLPTIKDTSMDWEVNKSQGKNRHYINNEVLGIIGIFGIESDVINIVIEELENQPFIEEVVKEQNNIEHCEG